MWLISFPAATRERQRETERDGQRERELGDDDECDEDDEVDERACAARDPIEEAHHENDGCTARISHEVLHPPLDQGWEHQGACEERKRRVLLQ